MSDEERPSRGRWKGCGLLLLLLAPLTFAVSRAFQIVEPHPTDAMMIAEFDASRPKFVVLRDLAAKERRVTRVADDFIWIDGIDSVSEEDRTSYLPDRRFALYRQLFRELKLDGGMVRREDGSVALLRSSHGLVTGGSTKEFVWSQRAVPQALSAADPRSLEDACQPSSGCSSFRQIAPHWYIRLSSN